MFTSNLVYICLNFIWTRSCLLKRANHATTWFFSRAHAHMFVFAITKHAVFFESTFKSNLFWFIWFNSLMMMKMIMRMMLMMMMLILMNVAIDCKKQITEGNVKFFDRADDTKIRHPLADCLLIALLKCNLFKRNWLVVIRILHNCLISILSF